MLIASIRILKKKKKIYSLHELVALFREIQKKARWSNIPPSSDTHTKKMQYLKHTHGCSGETSGEK